MIAIQTTAEWRSTHPDGSIGLLELSGVDNTVSAATLDGRKREVEGRLREKYRGFSRSDFMAAPIFAEYERYYKAFDKSYHVQLQVESIVLKGKSLPNVSPLVDANFVAEVETLILTAGHDVERLVGPVSIDISKEGDTITQMNGTTKPIRPGDMVMRDAEGICCTILYGQDGRSPISSDTSHVLYVAYVPAGIPREQTELQLQGIVDNVRSFAPNCVVEQLRIL